MRNLLYLVSLILLAGCSYAGSVNTKGLDEAERMMHSDPAAALDRLNTFSPDDFSDSATMARWALLYSEAMAANRLCAPTDTIVGIAIDYYGSHDMPEELRHATRLKALLADTGRNDRLATALYLQKEKEFMLYKEKSRRETTLTVCIAIIIAAIAVIMWQSQRIRLKNARYDSLIAEASGLNDELTRHRSENSSMETRLLESLQKRFSILDELCQTYYESQGTKIERKALSDKVLDQIFSLQADQGLFKEMEDNVSQCHGIHLKELRQAFPDMKQDDYRLYIYMACNLSNRSIALLLGQSIDTVYKRKSRLRKRLSDAGISLPAK